MRTIINALHHLIYYDNPSQILNMGGPWKGDLYIDGNFLVKDCLIDNIIYDSESNRLYFVKYHKSGKWRKDVTFTVNILDLTTLTERMSKHRFDMLYISKFDKGSLTLVNAFHDKGNLPAINYCLENNFIDV